MTPSTYVYTYIVFALVYLVSSLTLAAWAFRATGAMSRASSDAAADGSPDVELAHEYVEQGQKLIDVAQLATLLPLAYIVGSIFLGSTILRDVSWAGLVNAIWVAVTLIAAGSAIWLAARAMRTARSLAQIDASTAIAGHRVTEATRRLSSRLGVSTALLVIIAVFITLNLWSVISNFDTLVNLEYVL